MRKTGLVNVVTEASTAETATATIGITVGAEPRTGETGGGCNRASKIRVADPITNTRRDCTGCHPLAEGDRNGAVPVESGETPVRNALTERAANAIDKEPIDRAIYWTVVVDLLREGCGA